MGGSDPRNFTFKIIKDLNNLNYNNIKYQIIIGELYKNKFEKKLKKSLIKKNNFKIYRNPKNLYSIFKRSDFGIINSGNIKYEFAALGIPFYIFANDNKSKLFCNYFSKEFKFFSSKNFDYPKKNHLKKILNQLIFNDKKLKFYSNYNKKKIDFKSVDKITEHINNTIV